MPLRYKNKIKVIMHFLEEHTLAQLKELGPPVPGAKIVVAVSGGADSVALLHLLAAVAGYLALDLVAVYVDHGLRPEETAAEAELVREMALRLGADFRTGRVAVREYGDAEGVSVETAARNLRYEFLEQVACEMDAVAIAVAHTADDQAEEVLLRLIRGTGRNGLAGMRPVNFRRVIRPLLQLTKAQLLAYLSDRNLPFLEDSSNAAREYLRNRVRLDLLPYLAENFNPAIRQTLLRTADILAGEDELLATLAHDLYQRVVTIEKKPEILLLDIAKLPAAHPALQRRVVELALLTLGAKPSFQQIDKLLDFAAAAENGKELHLAEGLRVEKRVDALALSYPVGRSRHRLGLGPVRQLSFVRVIGGPGNWPIEELGLQVSLEIVAQRPSQVELTGTGADYLDMAGIVFPLIARSARPGDRFQPLGGPGSRKVADFLSDRKVPREERSRVVVLENAGKIIALPGLRVDHRFRIVPGTEKVLKIRLLAG